MKMKRIVRIVVGFTIMTLIGSLFGSALVGHAQSSQAWSDPMNLSNSGASTAPSMVVDSNGIIHVLWVDKIDGYKYSQSVDKGLTWTPPKAVNFPFSPRGTKQPVLLAGKDGEIYVFWQDESGALFYSLAGSATFGQPGTWIGNKKLADAVISFSAVVSAKNVLHLGYILALGTAATPPGVYYQRFSQSWSTATTLYISQYYRSLTSTDVNVSVAVSTENDIDIAMVAWDDRSQKRIFFAKSSADEKNTWKDAWQVSGPEQLAGSEMPYNIKVSAFENKVLLLWQVGIPGSQCIQYSQWSDDTGDHFADPVKMLNDSVACPKQSTVIIQDKDFAVTLLNIQDEISLLAWSGTRWSKLQDQSALSTFLNPLTFDNVIFGCQNIAVYDNSLFMVGCDTGTGGDIWFSFRPLGSLDEWFPPPSAWTSPTVVTTTKQMLSSLTTVADDKKNVHAFWVQVPLTKTEDSETTIVYSRWNENGWSDPKNILSGFNASPMQLSGTVDKQGRILLSWVEGRNGDLFFSWTNAERAYLASEWYKPLQLPSPSQINSSPDILVDDLDRIAIVYAVPINEGRGIYLVQSTDLGRTWSKPALIFDAAAAGWNSVDQPAISLSSDGRLHVLFTRVRVRDADQVGGLYYAQSGDGGVTWSQPEMVSENDILWSRIVSFDQQIHRIWKERKGNAFNTMDQVSPDGGVTWENSIGIASENASLGLPEIAESPDGRLYLAQAGVQDKDLTLNVHEWNGSHWTAQDQQDITVDATNAQASIATSINNQGVLNAVVSVVYTEAQTRSQNEVISLSRSLDLSGNNGEPALVQIPTPANLATVTSPEVQATPTELLSAEESGSQAPAAKNIVGIAFVGGIILLIVMFTVFGRRGKTTG
jgi:hypothetical protein